MTGNTVTEFPTWLDEAVENPQDEASAPLVASGLLAMGTEPADLNLRSVVYGLITRNEVEPGFRHQGKDMQDLITQAVEQTARDISNTFDFEVMVKDDGENALQHFRDGSEDLVHTINEAHSHDYVITYKLLTHLHQSDSLGTWPIDKIDIDRSNGRLVHLVPTGESGYTTYSPNSVDKLFDPDMDRDALDDALSSGTTEYSESSHADSTRPSLDFSSEGSGHRQVAVPEPAPVRRRSPDVTATSEIQDEPTHSSRGDEGMGF